jgi:hypothetical protein
LRPGYSEVGSLLDRSGACEEAALGSGFLSASCVAAPPAKEPSAEVLPPPCGTAREAVLMRPVLCVGLLSVSKALMPESITRVMKEPSRPTCVPEYHRCNLVASRHLAYQDALLDNVK